MRRSGVLLVLAAAAALLGAYMISEPGTGETPDPSRGQTRIGINLFGAQTFNRQQVFTNLIAQSEWFSSEGKGWTPMPAAQLDRHGWPRYLNLGQTAPRPLTIPPTSARSVTVHCRFAGKGAFSAGGIAALSGQSANQVDLVLRPTGGEGDGAWIELTQTSFEDPVRDIDCREAGRPVDERFHPDFTELVREFHILRFLDWQRTNDNFAVAWDERSTPRSSSQVASAGVAPEDMVDLANLMGADPWFLMPYRADDAYIRSFAELVHQRLDPRRVVYVELGNEVWNDMFDAAQQAEREGIALGLAMDNPKRAQTIRYADKVCRAMRIWADVFADQPDRLVRVASSQNAYPELAEIILSHKNTADCIDALATAPYIWLNLEGKRISDTEWIFAQMPRAVEDAIAFAARNRAIAASHGKRYIAYEGGQHLVTPDLELARAIQRDPRMGEVYRSYLALWDERIRSELVLYASTAPISEYGSWGLREYSGQPEAQTPKLTAVRRFMGALR